ncbi:MAG: zf-HC2 domain-containing protein [Bacteroidota bacterium]
MNKICKIILLQLPDFVQGKTSKDDSRIIQEHIQECTDCRKEAEDLREVFTSILSEGAFSAPSEAYWNTIVPRIHEQLKRRGRRSKFMPGWIYRIVLPLATVSLVIVLLFRNNIFSPATSQGELRKAIQQMTDEERTIVFHETIATTEEGIDEYPVTDSLFVLFRSDIRDAAKSGVFEYTLTPFEHQFVPEALLESLSPEEVEQILEKLQTQQNITS